MTDETTTETPEMSREEKGLLAAKKAETEKRQAIEAEYQAEKAKWEAEKQQMQQLFQQYQQPNPQTEEKTFWDAPEEYFQKFERRLDQMQAQNKLATSQANARAKHKDYDDAWNEYLALVKSDPAMDRVAMEQSDPFEWAYQKGKLELDRKQNDPALIEERVRKQLMEEYGLSVPKSLSSEQSASGETKTSSLGWGDVIGK